MLSVLQDTDGSATAPYQFFSRKALMRRLRFSWEKHKIQA